MTRRNDSYGGGEVNRTPPDEIIRLEFGSMDEYVDYVLREDSGICYSCWTPTFQGIESDGGFWTSSTDERTGRRLEGGWGQLVRYARDGWRDRMAEALDVTDRAVKWVETEVESFEPVHDVTGGEVDVAAALAGLPEDMVQYPPQKISNLGTLITLCADVGSFNSVSAESVMKRGEVIAALALALDRLGHQTELWISDEYQISHSGDMYGKGSRVKPDVFGTPRPTGPFKQWRVTVRVKIKGANDFIDPARIMFAYAHPGVQRGLGFTAVQNLGGNVLEWPKTALCLGPRIHNAGFGNPVPMTRDMEEGTVYLPAITRNADAPNVDRELRMFLRQIGLVSGGLDDE